MDTTFSMLPAYAELFAFSNFTFLHGASRGEELVTRAAHASDRRQVVLTVTPAGRELVAKARRRRDAWLARRLNELTPQERATLRAAAPILEKLSQS